MAYTLPAWANSPATTSPLSAANLTQLNTAINGLDTRVGQAVVSVKDFGVIGDGSTDDTTAIQAAITATLTPNGGALYFPVGTYKITAAIVIPFSTRWRIFGASRGSTIISQFTNNTQIFTFTSDLTHSWSISSMTFTYNSAQPATNTSSYALYFDPGSSKTVFNWLVTDVLFDNCFRCMGVNPASTQVALWGWHLDRIQTSNTVTGWLISNQCAAAIGTPNMSISRCYLDCAGQTEPMINIVAADNISLNDVEFNNGNYNGFSQMAITSSAVVTLKNVKSEVVTIQNGTTLWSFSQSSVVALGVKLLTATTSGSGNSCFMKGDSGGSLFVAGLQGNASGNVCIAYSFDDVKFVSDVVCSGVLNKDPRTLGNLTVSRINADVLSQNATLVRGDVSVTLTATDYRVQYFNTALTANRTVTLPSAGLVDGFEFEIVRYALGAFTLTVTDPLTSKNHTFASSTKGFVRYRAVSSSEWLKVAAGTLP